nr:exodeoxyribonuclease V subunit gamma [Pseudactinotalea sp. HY160]
MSARVEARVSVPADTFVDVSISVHRADRLDALADGLGELLAADPGDVFELEPVVVPSPALGRWLAQRLSHRLGAGAQGPSRRGDGVCAGLEFTSPRSLTRLVTGRDDEDPWRPDRLAWHVLAEIDAAAEEDWAAPVAWHIGARAEPPAPWAATGRPDPGDEAGLDGIAGLGGLGVPVLTPAARRDRRYSVARRVAGLLWSYADERPELVRGWLAGHAGGGRGARGPHAEATERWQAELYRRLTARLGADPRTGGRADLLEGAGVAIPRRLNIVVPARLSPADVEVLAAVADVSEVHLWLCHPSPRLWNELAAAPADPAADPALRPARADDDSDTIARHPLLVSLGRELRELQLTLAPLLERAATDVAPPVARPANLLGRLQADLAADRPPAPTGRRLEPGDRSVQVHACHGPTRQVEALREILTGLFADDPTLEPRDVVIMCPDLDTYGPAIQAAFGMTEATGPVHPAHGFRVGIATRGRVNPLVQLALTLVELTAGRIRASDLLDLLGRDVVRRRFRLTDDDLATLTTWVGEAGIRWGLDRADRADFGVDLPHNTLTMGLRSLLLGAAMAEDGRSLGNVLPVDNVPSGAIDLAGRFAEATHRLRSVVAALRAATTLADWSAALLEATHGLGAVGPDEEWLAAQADADLTRMAGSDGLADAPAGIADVRGILRGLTDPQRSRGGPGGVRTGSLTVAPLGPLRGVPHRVVCLLGMDDGTFPRAGRLDGDDLLAPRPRIGERDVRAEDRQLFLDAIMAATDTLVITYSGADQYRGARLQPAVPVAELLDVLEATAPGEGRRRVHVEEPLQPFDARYFTPGTALVSFDRAAAAAAAARSGDLITAESFLAHPLPPPPPADVLLADLQGYFVHPVRGFVRDRLDVGVSADHEPIADDIPLDARGLVGWQIGDRLLQRALAGADPDVLLAAERLRGELPPAELGRRELEVIAARVGRLLGVSEQLRAAGAEPVDCDVPLDPATPGARRLIGQVQGVRGSDLVRIHYSSLGPKHRLAAWIDLLAVQVSHPERAWRAHVIARYGRGARHVVLGPLPARDAARELAVLVDIRDRGLTEPLPLPIRTSHAWALAHADPGGNGHRQREAAKKQWERGFKSPVPGENEDPYHRLVWGELSTGALLEQQVRTDLGETWFSGVPSRLGQYALRLWQALLLAERRG